MDTSKHYTVALEDGTTFTRARKDAAVKAGSETGLGFQVFSPSGKVVYSDIPSGSPMAAETDPVAEEAPAPRPKKPVDLEKQKEKIRMLLAKAESTTFPEERDTFNAAAEKLMLRLGLDAAELQAEGAAKEDGIIFTQRSYRGQYAIVMVPFAADIAQGYGGVSVLFYNVRGSDERITYLVGQRSDIEMVTQLLDSLDLQVMTALRKWQKDNVRVRYQGDRMSRYHGNRSFITGFGARVSARLKEAREEIFAEASSGAALVLSNKSERVSEWVAENFNPKVNRGGALKHDFSAMLDGAAAGENAELVNQKKVSE